MFVKGILRKYQVLVDNFEARKAKADLTDNDEMDALRRSLTELQTQMVQAKSLNLVLTDLEKKKVETSELVNLLKFHKVDLAIVQAGSRQALAKAKAHKDALFQAFIQERMRNASIATRMCKHKVDWGVLHATRADGEGST